jgi:hypothetical protein
VAHEIALLANSLLRESGAGEWDYQTLTALKKIRGSDHGVFQAFAPNAPKPAPVQEPWPDDKLPF